MYFDMQPDPDWKTVIRGEAGHYPVRVQGRRGHKHTASFVRPAWAADSSFLTPAPPHTTPHGVQPLTEAEQGHHPRFYPS